jgi:hypothetical protein
MPDYYAQRYPVDAPGEGRGGTADGACPRASVLPGRGALHARKVLSAWKAHSSAGLLMVWQGGQARGTCRLPSCCDSRRVAPPPLLQACRATWTAEPTQCCPPPCAPAAQPTSSMPSRWAAAGGRRMRLRGRRPMLGSSFVCGGGWSWAGAIQHPTPGGGPCQPPSLPSWLLPPPQNESTGTKTFTLFGPAGGGTNLTAFHFETKASAAARRSPPPLPVEPHARPCTRCNNLRREPPPGWRHRASWC